MKVFLKNHQEISFVFDFLLALFCKPQGSNCKKRKKVSEGAKLETGKLAGEGEEKKGGDKNTRMRR